MGIKKFRPYTPSRRHLVNLDFSELTPDSQPQKGLLIPRKQSGGRNSHGHITSRHRGGGHKRMIRLVDFKRDRRDAPAKVQAIEYDPNRTARLALLEYPDGEKRYILAPRELTVGAQVMAGPEAQLATGNAMPLQSIPLGTLVHNVELQPGHGGQMVRSAGSSAQILAREAGFVTLRLPSGEMRRVPEVCYATIGMLGNVERESIRWGKAGRSRWRGRRPQSRGVAMNPIDHPHGGGEGKSPQGNPHPVSPWGLPTKGYKTRTRNKPSNRFIVNRRHKRA